MIGAIIGDVVGSRFEFHNHLSKDFELFARGCEFTDDSVMTCAVAQGLMDSRYDWSDLSEKTVAAMRQIIRQDKPYINIPKLPELRTQFSTAYMKILEREELSHLSAEQKQALEELFRQNLR